MRRITTFSCLATTMTLLITGCDTSIPKYASDSENKGDVKVLTLDGALRIKQYSLAALEQVRDAKIRAHQRGMDLVVEELNLLLVEKGIYNAALKSDEVVHRLTFPDPPLPPVDACPFVHPIEPSNMRSCWYLIKEAMQSVRDKLPQLTIEQESVVESPDDSTCGMDGLLWWSTFYLEAVESGIMSSLPLLTETLREKKICDQSPSTLEGATFSGMQEGYTLMAQAKQRVLPTISEGECDTEFIALQVLAEAKARTEGYVQENPICAGVPPEEISPEVDLAVVEKDRLIGIDLGMEQEYEMLRMRLAVSWMCNSCVCLSGGNGTLPTACFLRSQLEQKGKLVEGKTIWEELEAGEAQSLYDLVGSGAEQCRSEQCIKRMDQMRALTFEGASADLDGNGSPEVVCKGGTITIEAPFKSQLLEMCDGGIPLPFSL
jgi:hypothetical protein